jgi:hypothetical protein
MANKTANRKTETKASQRSLRQVNKPKEASGKEAPIPANDPALVKDIEEKVRERIKKYRNKAAIKVAVFTISAALFVVVGILLFPAGVKVTFTVVVSIVLFVSAVNSITGAFQVIKRYLDRKQRVIEEEVACHYSQDGRSAVDQAKAFLKELRSEDKHL